MSIKHKITTKQIEGEAVTRIYRSLIRQAALLTLKNEQIDMPCVVSVLIAEDTGIRDYNRRFRNIDKSTDVLSFPMQYFNDAGWKNIAFIDKDLDTGTVPLGDIIISTETIRRNARRYKHSFEHETVRMIVHSTLHLIGYDHGFLMQKREDIMMQSMGYFND